MTKRPLKAISILGALALTAAACTQSNHDFSGTWVMNAAKGKNLGMVAAIEETTTIVQTPEKLTLNIASTFQGKTSNRQVIYDLSGKPVINEGAMGDKSETVARWDGAKLVVTWTSEAAVAGSKNIKTETRSLSADGKTMTVTSQRGSNTPMELVYEKK